MITMAQARGEWLLIDMLNQDQYALLSLGRMSYSGSSVRKNLDAAARELLMDRIRSAHETGAAVDDRVIVGEGEVRVRVEPILTPERRVVIGARAIIADVDQELPKPPVVGALEWRVSDSGGRIETFWDEQMFSLYGLSRTGAGSATGDMSEWIASLIAPEDRARMKVVIDGGIAAPDGQRHMVAYRIVTPNDEGEQFKHLEASGRVFMDDEEPIKWLRSLTREVTPLEHAVAPSNVDMSSGSLLRAAFELSGDTAMIAVDIKWWQMFMTSPNWEELNLCSPRRGYLPHVIHPDDLEAFRTECDTGQVGPGSSVRFLHNDGKYYSYQVSASNGHFDRTGTQRYVIVALRPIE